MRVDKFLVAQGYFESRNKAIDALKQGQVKIDGKVVKKQSYKVQGDEKVEILEKIFVSRSALKLKNYLDKHKIDVKNKIALDIGSSTGGFSQILLLNGVKKVVCVDVGKNQLHQKIRNDERSEVYEETDIRNFNYHQKFDIVVSDVSFISLLKIIKKIDELAKLEIILLFKPQFEVGREAKRDKRGVVVDKNAILTALENFKKETKKLNWRLIREEESSILGKEGNKEYILHFRKENDA